MKAVFFKVVLSLSFFVGCVTEYDFHLDGKKQTMVINAYLSNKPNEFYVRILRSYLIDSLSGSYPKAVTNAVVYLIENDKDSTLISYQLGQSVDNDGYYKNTQMVAKPDHYYKLSVTVESVTYQSVVATPKPFSIDSVNLVKLKYFSEGGAKVSPNYTPRVYFKKPISNDPFYLVFYRDTAITYSDRYYFQGNNFFNYYNEGGGKISFFNSELNQNENIILDLEDTGIIGFEDNFPVNYLPLSYSLISKDVYDFYQSLIYQFENDGGGFSPSPASPPTNFDNGAQGFFIITNPSYKVPQKLLN